MALSRYSLGVSLEGLSKTTKNICQDALCLGLNSKRGPIKYKPRALQLDQLVSYTLLHEIEMFTYENYADKQVLPAAKIISA
jgi:hypothetical protein